MYIAVTTTKINTFRIVLSPLPPFPFTFTFTFPSLLLLFFSVFVKLWAWTPEWCVNEDAVCRSAGERSVARVSADQGTARIPRELKLPRGSGLWELYPIRAERRRAVNIPIAPLSPPPSPTPSVCSSHSSSPRFISRSLLSALADSNGKTERRVFHSPAWTQNVERKSGKVGTLSDQIAPHRDFICSQEEVKKRKESALWTCRLAWIISAAVARFRGILLYGTR